MANLRKYIMILTSTCLKHSHKPAQNPLVYNYSIRFCNAYEGESRLMPPCHSENASNWLHQTERMHISSPQALQPSSLVVSTLYQVLEQKEENCTPPSLLLASVICHCADGPSLQDLSLHSVFVLEMVQMVVH